MIGALRKIEGRSRLEAAPDEVRPSFLDDPPGPDLFARPFATHPSIDDHVAALVQTAGGRDPGARTAPPFAGYVPHD